MLDEVGLNESETGETWDLNELFKLTVDNLCAIADCVLIHAAVYGLNGAGRSGK
jgi:hypothetical protein